MTRTNTETVLSFGPFEADFHTRELRKHGVRLRLPQQSFQILQLLLERPGNLVSREQLRRALWPADTFVDFDKGINAAIKRLRETLGDCAEEPSLIETLPKRGYRFVGTITSTSRRAVPPSQGRPRSLRIVAWTVTVAVCAFTAVLVYYKSRHLNEPTTFTPVPFTAYVGNELYPTFSPDGSQIAFAWDGDPPPGSKGFDLYVKVIGSENLLRLTHRPSDSIAAAWSSDGTQIAFHRMAGPDTGIYVVPALGGVEKRLRSTHMVLGSSHNPPISWSPDGKWIAYREYQPAEQGYRIHLLSVETLEVRQVFHVAECLQEGLPAFSHSGKLLAYGCLLKTGGNEVGIYTIATAGGIPTLVTRFRTGLGYAMGFAWTADDAKFILSRPQTGDDFELDEVGLAHGSLRKMPFGQNGRWPAISAKGDKLAYVSLSSDRGDIWRKDLLHPEAAATRLLSSTRDQTAPQYSPDGAHIAFASNRGGSWEIWMSDADGTHLVQMSDFKTSESGNPRWSPDSQKIAFDSRNSGHLSVFIVDISERMPREVSTNLSDISTPSWSHDGKWLYFQARTARSPTERIHRCLATGGDAVAVSADLGSYPSESYGGDAVYFADRLGSVRLHAASLKSLGTETVLKGIPEVAGRTRWTVAPGGIYFVSTAAPKSVHYFDFATSTVRPVFDAEKEFGNGLSVSQDGRWILFTQIDGGNSDIMLVEHLQ
jgi:Tol biopolymer transport system component/DNA-binding winged helix-turn-helix (wHTH) protein